MRYKINGLTIRSENAAKPVETGSKWLLDILKTLPRNFVALDYGCGKLRYSIPLAKRVRKVIGVDSKIQIHRTQTILKESTTVLDLAKSVRGLKVCDLNSKSWRNRKYDFILCANVLTAIPTSRDRLKVLRVLRKLLRPPGRLLLVAQYRNGYFGAYKKNPKARWVRDGWLIKNENGNSFYAMLRPPVLAEMCRDVNLRIESQFTKGDAAYVFAMAK